MIKKETIEEIKNVTRIEEIVGEFVTLKKQGTYLQGLCPFHNEKTPSFTVTPSKGIYKCFGCGASGDAAKFLMDHEHYTYPESLRYLADKYNITIEETQPTEEQKQEEQEKESLFAVNSFASKHFTNRLWQTNEGKSVGLSYFRNRGFHDATIEKFNLGYSPEKWDDLTAAALNNGYKLTYLEKSGLTITKNNRSFDRFRNRVIFPIHNISGRVIAFAGRILSQDKKQPKYVNSPETDIYYKSRILYGLHQARAAIAREDNCLLVEGYTDVISLHQSGIENVVSSSGTSLTEEQIQLIRRFTKNITILYDGDEAGLKASFRGIDMILEQDMNVKVVIFPEEEDPDSYARNNRSEDTQNFIKENAKDFITFKTNILLEEVGDNPVRRAETIKDIVTTISKIPDQITRTVYISECASILSMQEQTLMNELNKILRNKFRKKHKQKEELPESTAKAQQEVVDPKSPEEKSIESHERNIIRLLLNYGTEFFTLQKKVNAENKEESHNASDTEEQEEKINVAESIVSDISGDKIAFENPVYQKIFNIYQNFIQEGTIQDQSFFIQHEDREISQVSIDLVSEPFELSDNWKKSYKIYTPLESNRLGKVIYKTLHSFKLAKLDQRRKKLVEELKSLNAEADSELIINTMDKINKIDKTRQSIAAVLGRIVLK